MVRRFFLTLLLLPLAAALGQAPPTQPQAAVQVPDKDKIWRDFLDWLKAQPDVNSLGRDQYRASLVAGGLTAAQADERMAVVGKLLAERRGELSTIYFNKLYVTERQERFTTEPSAFLASVTKGVKPGKALDIAMGQGRNAVYLATQGWDVTGYDLADDGLRVANENAARAGVRISTVHAGFEDFDYGKDRWDLIYFVYTDAPMTDPKFVSRICAALKPGGLVVVDRPYRPLGYDDPEWNGPVTDQDKPNALPKAWSDLQIVLYEDTTGIGDWQQTATKRLEKKLRIVHMLARKL